MHAIGLIVFVALLLLALLVLLVSPWLIGIRARRTFSRHQAFLEHAGVDVLVREAQESIRREGWHLFAAGASLLARTSGWTEGDLLDALAVLFDELNRDDSLRGRQGRESNYFEFYDSGLASIVEALERRTGRPFMPPPAGPGAASPSTP